MMELVSFYAGLDLKKQLTLAEASVPYGAWVQFATCPIKYPAMQGEDLSQWEPCRLCSLPLACCINLLELTYCVVLVINI